MNPSDNGITRGLVLLLLLSSGSALFSSSLTYPDYLQPGAVYREYHEDLRVDNDWRVTDPKAPHAGAREFLPNASFELVVETLEEVKQASIMISHWTGHGGTTGQIFYFNDSPGFNIPLSPNYPASFREHFNNLDNLFFDLPLEYINEGKNSFHGTLIEEVQGAHWWGQWGWYSLTLRAFHEPGQQQTSLRFANIEDRDSLRDNPVLQLNASSEHGIDRIEVFAHYYDYDENGDYSFNDWHGFFHGGSSPEGHVGTVVVEEGQCYEGKMYELQWNTQWIPDQQQGGIALIARMLDKKGFWHVGEVVQGLSLNREHRSVKMIPAMNVPPLLIRDGARETIKFKTGAHQSMELANNAIMKIRTWNGANNERGYTPFTLNGGKINDQLVGAWHYYALDTIPIDPEILVDGENIMEIFSKTHHHGCEVLLPGPALLVEWNTVGSEAR